jgi:outer membrane protein TolC
MITIAGCATPPPLEVRHLSLSPRNRAGGEVLKLDGGRAMPMYRELLAVDLPTVVRVARAQNLDIRQARARVEAAAGRHESSFGAIFPVISPQVVFERNEGVVRAVNGPVIGADFSSLAPAALVQWAINPGRVYYDIVASRKRLEASEHQERQTIQETMRSAAIQYYDLVLAQAKLAVAEHAVSEGEELLRITQLRRQAGAGLEADALRAEADLARRRQDLAIALNAFYEASIALSVTLHLDPTVTLVPRPDQVPQLSLVADDMGIDQLLGLALAWRADLESVRLLVKASNADVDATTWGGLGPQLQVGYSHGAIRSDTSEANFGFQEQRRLTASAGWTLGLSTLGYLKTAGAAQQEAAINAERQLDLVRAQVVRAAQAGVTQAKLVPMARQQLKAAEEALRLAQANLRAGTMLTLDVLQAADAVDQARLRYADAVVRYNQSQVNLLAAVGVIDEQNVLEGGSASGPATKPASNTTATTSRQTPLQAWGNARFADRGWGGLRPLLPPRFRHKAEAGW